MVVYAGGILGLVILRVLAVPWQASYMEPRETSDLSLAFGRKVEPLVDTHHDEEADRLAHDDPLQVV